MNILFFIGLIAFESLISSKLRNEFVLLIPDLPPDVIKRIVLSKSGSLRSPNTPKLLKSSGNTTVGSIPLGSLELSLFLISNTSG